MGVQSYLALYTTLLGWQSYDQIFSILSQLGLILLPFAFIAARSVSEPFLSMGAKGAGEIGARRFIIHIISALFVLVFAAVPMVRLTPNVLHFKPHCEKSNFMAKPGHTGTTYDQKLPMPQSVKVPMVFYIVMALSNGITDQAEDAISCPMVNLRDLQNELTVTQINSVPLKQEVMRFQNACYIPAYNTFLQDNQSNLDQSAIQNALKKYGKDDIGWMGSALFQNVPGFYDKLSAKSPVAGFPYSGTGVNNQINAQTGTPKWGAPTCKTWWQNPTVGLRAKLFEQFGKKAKAQLAEIDYEGDPARVQDAAIHAMLVKSTGGNFFSPGFYTEQQNQSGLDNFLAKWFSKGYVDYLSLDEYPKIQILKNALPIVQALLLAAFFMMLAIALPLSGYSLGFVITASIFMFSIIFCSFLWHWVSWFDQFLLQALYGAGPTSGHPDPVKLVWHLAESAVNPEKNLANITISLFYIVLPLVWLSIVGWCGVSAGSAMSFGGLDAMSQRGGGKSVALPKGPSTPAQIHNNKIHFGAGSSYVMKGGK